MHCHKAKASMASSAQFWKGDDEIQKIVVVMGLYII